MKAEQQGSGCLRRAEDESYVLSDKAQELILALTLLDQSLG